MYLRKLMIALIVIGAVLIAYNLGAQLKECPNNIKYRFLPRDYNVDKYIPDGVSYKFKDLFEKPTPFIIPIGNENKRILH